MRFFLSILFLLPSISQATPLTPDRVEQLLFENCSRYLGRWWLQTLPLNAVAMIKPQEKLKDTPYNLGMKQVRKVIEQVRMANDPRLDRPIHTVLYPLSGMDARLPAMLFPHATVLVGIDKIPFRSKSNKAIDYPLPRFLDGEAPSEDVEVPPFQENLEIAKEKNIVASVLTSLYMAVPRFHVLETKLIFRKGSNEYHGLIRFNQGPGTREKVYLHLNASIDEEPHSNLNHWMTSFLEELAPQAVVVKAADGVLSPTSSASTPSQLPFRKKLLEWLKKNKGFLIEGNTNPFDGVWEMSGKLPSDKASEELEVGYVPGILFGYGEGVRVSSRYTPERAAPVADNQSKHDQSTTSSKLPVPVFGEDPVPVFLGPDKTIKGHRPLTQTPANRAPTPTTDMSPTKPR